MSLITFTTDNFLTGGRGSPNAISPGSDGASWTQQRGDQVASYVSNQAVFTYVASTNLGVWTYGSTSQTDQEALVNVVQSTANNEIVGAVLRLSDNTHFYYADIGNSSGNVEIGKIAGGSFTPLALAPFSSSFGTKYSIRFQAIGSTLKAKVWDAATTEPTAWSVQFTDTTLFAGLSGVCMAPAGSSTCKFDTFSATNGDVPVTNPVDPAHGAEQRGLVAGALNAPLVPAQDISAYGAWSLQIDTIASGGIVTFQGSNDGINWKNIQAKRSDGVITTSTSVTGCFSGPRLYRYYQAIQTAWTSGLTTGTFELFVSAHDSIELPTWLSSIITTQTTTVVKKGSGVLHSLWIPTPVASAVVQVYDNTAASGTKLCPDLTLPATLLSDGPLPVPDFDANFSTGLTIVTSGATMGVSVYYS